MYKLMIADDEVIEREAIKYITSKNFEGVFEICEAASGRELIEKATTFKPDIIFTDIKMPGINGLEAVAKIQGVLAECRIIILSAFNYFNFARDAIAIGVDDFIIKPASSNVIVEALNKAIRNIDDSRLKKKIEQDTSLKLKNITLYLEEELIFLMSSGETDEKVVKEFFGILDIECTAFICAVISFSDRSLPEEIGGEVQKRIVKKRMMEKLKSRLDERGKCSFQGSVGQEICLLLLVDEDMDDYEARVLWTKQFSEIRDRIYDEMHIRLNIGIGNQCKTSEQIYNSFLQAKIALKYHPVPGSVTSYGDIRTDNVNAVYPHKKEKNLLESLLELDAKNSLQIIDELIDWMTVNLSGIESIKQKIYELLLILMREAAINLNMPELDSNSESMRKDLFLLDTTREFRAYAKSYIENKIHDLNNIKISRANSLLSLITDYIRDNFDKEISLESVADVIRVSPYYLSKLFKKETGANFIDYLTNFRIKKAKELLANPTNNVKDVCYMVGYKDPNYFARVFKKTCSITPSEYRDKKLQAQRVL